VGGQAAPHSEYVAPSTEHSSFGLVTPDPDPPSELPVGGRGRKERAWMDSKGWLYRCRHVTTAVCDLLITNKEPCVAASTEVGLAPCIRVGWAGVHITGVCLAEGQWSIRRALQRVS